MVLDLGSGKGFPSLLWASLFGARVEGFDVNEKFVEYSASRAKMMNLTARVRYSCQDIRKLKPSEEYDVVASLGLGVAQIYGSHSDALELSKTMLGKNGVLILAEPVWLSRPVSPETLEALGETADDFLTEPEMQRLMRKSGFEELGSFASSKIDWEIYVRPVYLAVQEIIQAKSKLAEEAQRVIDGFRAEYDAVGCDWNMAVGVVRSL